MRKIILIVFLVASVIAYSQENNLNNKRYIEVTGTSETEVTPDEIYLTITLTERSESRDKLSIEKQESELKKHIKELGIDISNLTLNSADADYHRVRAFKKDVTVSKQYLLKVASAEMLSKVYERLDQMNAQDAYISRYTHSKILELQKENRIKALKAAKEKCDYLCSAIAQQTGLPLQIMETESYVQDTPYNHGGMLYKNTAVSMDSDESSEISFKKIKIRSSYQVKYEILNK